ncbi:MAG TPA: GAF domain-containing protein [Actinocatenispora sp.]
MDAAYRLGLTTVAGRALLAQAQDGLARAETLGQAQDIMRSAARRLVDAQGATVVLYEDGQCFYADEDAISPLWKGQRFPAEQCISGWAMIHGEPAIVRDTTVDERIPQDAYRPTFVRSLAMVPVGGTAPIGAIGAYWAAPRAVPQREVALLMGLAAAAYPALRRLLPDGGTPVPAELRDSSHRAVPG